MLNVIITRAKQKVYVCTSFPQDFISQYPVLIQQKGNTGRGVLYAYLTYAKAVSDGNKELRNGILHILNQHCTDKHSETTAEITIGSESPFEDEVCELLIEHFGQQRIVQQYSIGGFRIDISILSKQTGEPFIAIECDGAKYHNSPEAFSWDCFRQEQLEQYGFIFYRIWSTNWWDSRDRELHNLIRFIESKDDEQ
jgi:very-short-patch-repair endonuclease